MRRFGNILVACSDSRLSAGLLGRVRWLAKANGAAVTILDVMEAQPGLLPRFLLALPEARAEAVAAQIGDARRHALEELAEPLRAEGVAVRVAVDDGPVFLQAIRRVLRDGHDLVIKDAERKGGWPFLRGPDLHLLRKCPCPVWLLHGPGQARSRRILAAVDTMSGEPAHEGLNRMVMQLATSLAQQDDAEVEVVSVWCVPEEWALSHGRVSLPETEVRAILSHARDDSAKRLEALVGGFPEAAERLQITHVKGVPADTIARIAQEQGVDTIVMGTVARTGIAGFFIGNTAETVLSRVACSVLAIKPEGFVSPVSPDGAESPTT